MSLLPPLVGLCATMERKDEFLAADCRDAGPVSVDPDSEVAPSLVLSLPGKGSF